MNKKLIGVCASLLALSLGGFGLYTHNNNQEEAAKAKTETSKLKEKLKETDEDSKSSEIKTKESSSEVEENSTQSTKTITSQTEIKEETKQEDVQEEKSQTLASYTDNEILAARVFLTKANTTDINGMMSVSKYDKGAVIDSHHEGSVVYPEDIYRVDGVSGSSKYSIFYAPRTGNEVMVYPIATHFQYPKDSSAEFIRQETQGMLDGAELLTIGNYPDEEIALVASKIDRVYSNVDEEVRQESSVDTKNLTSDQVKDWIMRDRNQTIPEATREDYFFEFRKDDNDLLVVDLLENHNSPRMKAAGTDPNTMPRAATYRINSRGELERENSARIGFDVVASDFSQP